ncbi:unnamed protein product [Rhizophagus irregularis]|nr:unnamed protein product [Rhizophagus irregularis]
MILLIKRYLLRNYYNDTKFKGHKEVNKVSEENIKQETFYKGQNRLIYQDSTNGRTIQGCDPIILDLQSSRIYGEQKGQ